MPRACRSPWSNPNSPPLSLLGYFNGAAVVMPKRLAQSNDQMKEFVGTGPYRLIEHVPDRHVRVARFDKYVSRPGPANGFTEEREALVPELHSIPVSNRNARVGGLLSGDYQYRRCADQ